MYDDSITTAAQLCSYQPVIDSMLLSIISTCDITSKQMSGEWLQRQLVPAVVWITLSVHWCINCWLWGVIRYTDFHSCL